MIYKIVQFIPKYYMIIDKRLVILNIYATLCINAYDNEMKIYADFIFISAEVVN